MVKKSSPRPTLAVHGAAGAIGRAQMTRAREERYRAGLMAALRAGYAVLDSGGCSLDAVVAAVAVLKDDPLFNTGRGATLTHVGGILEMERGNRNKVVVRRKNVWRFTHKGRLTSHSTNRLHYEFGTSLHC